VEVLKKIKCSTLDARELLNANRSSALSQEVQKLFLQQETNLQNRILFPFFHCSQVPEMHLQLFAVKNSDCALSV